METHLVVRNTDKQGYGFNELRLVTYTQGEMEEIFSAQQIKDLNAGKKVNMKHSEWLAVIPLAVRGFGVAN